MNTDTSKMQKPSKKNLFKFFKSDDFNLARVKFCAIYILLSYINELKEDIDRLMHGYNGVFVGGIKHTSKAATRAFEVYEKEYRAHISDDGSDICDATIDVTSALDNQLKQSQFFLQESTKAIYKALDEQIEKRVTDPEVLEKEASPDFEICSQDERKQALFVAKKMAKNHMAEVGATHETDFTKGVEVGFNIAINWINRIYIES